MYSENVKIHPWKGNNYDNTDPKILILGLSVYDKEEISKNTAQSYIEGLITGEWTHAFFTKIQNVFSNEKHISREIFWHDFCFYEYIQNRMDHPKEKVPNIYWENAKEPFIEIIKELKPDIILALGYGTYNNLPEFGKSSFKVTYKDQSLETWVYSIDDRNIFVCKIQHPSSMKFKQEIWSNLFRKFINKYKMLKEKNDF